MVRSRASRGTHLVLSLSWCGALAVVGKAAVTHFSIIACVINQSMGGKRGFLFISARAKGFDPSDLPGDLLLSHRRKVGPAWWSVAEIVSGAWNIRTVSGLLSPCLPSIVNAIKVDRQQRQPKKVTQSHCSFSIGILSSGPIDGCERVGEWYVARSVVFCCYYYFLQ